MNFHARFANVFRWTVVVALVCGMTPTRADDVKKETPKAEPTSRPVKYHPKNVFGSAVTPASGGIRGHTGEAMPFVSVLVPDQMGLTGEAQPTLYWYQSAKPAPGVAAVLTIETMLENGRPEPEPLAEFVVNPQQQGVCELDLSKVKSRLGKEVVLEPGHTYRWSIALVPNPPDRSQDLLESAYLRRVPAPAELKADQNPYARASAAAEAGLWYDALDVLSRAIEQKPQDSALRQTRAEFLEQAAKVEKPPAAAFYGLKLVADIDRAAAGQH